MDIWDTNRLVIFLAFVIPGFVGLKTYDTLLPNPKRAFEVTLLEAVAFSSVNYAVLAMPIYLVEADPRYTPPLIFHVAFWYLVLLICPVIWALLAVWIRKSPWAQGRFPHPTCAAWDFVFAKMPARFAVVTLKDGRKVGGVYAGESFASSHIDDPQIFLQRAWILNADGGFDRQVHQSAGVLIARDVQTVEFYLSGDTDARSEETH